MHFLKSSRVWSQLCATLFITCSLLSCMDHVPTDTPNPVYLVSSTKVQDVPIEQLKVLVGTTSPYYGLLKYGLSAYKLVYKTQNWDGTTINASGLVLVPATTEQVPMISQQHGTIFDNAEAPSTFGPTSEAFQYSTIFSSSGYIITCPDYIGFGESKNQFHTYEHRASLAQTSLDMLRATREFIKNNSSIHWDTRLYLGGYSEGGYATMSLYKKMQEEVPTEFNLRAVSSGAGAYDKTTFTLALLTQPSVGNVQWNRAFLWVLLTYNKIYPNLRRDLNYYIKPQYLDEVNSRQQLATLNVSFNEVLTDQFKAGLVSGSDKAFLAALADNDVYNWKPMTPLLLTHGTADQQVYFLNSVKAYTVMHDVLGSQVVQFAPVPDKTHLETIPFWLDYTYKLFTTIK